ncbi:F0F1 ATP synthase subunit A [Candidatus Gottesmanbacteria bacterium]|nr:F0F1 ATP synthase subunit A [Candidatus Gottesmanbacteria bacterium]
MPHISLAAEKLGYFWGLPITNALLTTWLVMVLLIFLAWMVSRNLQMVPSRIQSLTELVIGGLYDFFSQVTGKHIALFFPLLASLFLFIITANWVGLLPGVGTVGFFKTHETEAVVPNKELAVEPVQDSHVSPTDAEALPETVSSEEKEEFVPLFRGATADLNTTLGLALVAVLAIQYFGFVTLGGHYSTRFLNFKNPIEFFLGILETVSEISKVISFAFRLFGNIFAGEVLLAVMAFLMPFIVPLPFLMLELFVGFIQALVFSMLTAVFLNVAVSHGGGESHHG